MKKIKEIFSPRVQWHIIMAIVSLCNIMLLLVVKWPFALVTLIWLTEMYSINKLIYVRYKPFRRWYFRAVVMHGLIRAVSKQPVMAYPMTIWVTFNAEDIFVETTWENTRIEAINEVNRIAGLFDPEKIREAEKKIMAQQRKWRKQNPTLDYNEHAWIDQVMAEQELAKKN